MKFDTTTFLYTLYSNSHEPYSDCQNILIAIGGQLHFNNRKYEVMQYDTVPNPYEEDEEVIIQVICREISNSDMINSIVRDLKIKKLLQQ